jgi:Squalene-hopene cyclase C-terminal domain/Prenyltransferase and squalene oxidase repeat
VRFLLQSGMCLLLAAAVLAAPLRAADPNVGPDPKEVKAALDKALAYLRKHQEADGSFSPQRAGPGITALVAAGLLRNGVSPEDPVVAKALAYLESKVQKDGGVYDKFLANYTTSIAIMAFAEANTNGKYDTLIKNATAFVKKLQYDESKVDEKDPSFGGVGYDGRTRPDLSNTQIFLEAMQAAGVPKDDPAVQRALKFVSRCQNLPGETNDQPFAKKTTPDDKGGLTYNPLDPDEKNPNRTPDGGLRSLGAMTYAGLKSFLYAGVSKDDPRVKGAINWVRGHYTLEENPGQGQSGLYYYYHTFAKALTAWGDDRFEDAKGNKHDWRKELFAALKKRQRDDGSWFNDTKDRTYAEDNADLATAFAVLSLSYCVPAKK